MSVNWTFSARCYGWGVTGEYRLKIGDFAPTGAGWSTFRVGGVAPTNDSSSQKTRLNDLSYGKKRTDLSSVLSQSTRLTDGRTDRQTDSFLIARPRLHSMQRGKNSLYTLATIWRKPVYLPCKNRTSQRKKPAETWPRMRSIYFA